MNMRTVVILLLCLVLWPLLGVSSSRVREALQRGDIVALTPVLEWLERYYHGQAIEVELEEEQGMMVYEVEWLSPTGEVLDFRFEAASGTFLEVRGQGIIEARRDVDEIEP